VSERSVGRLGTVVLDTTASAVENIVSVNTVGALHR